MDPGTFYLRYTDFFLTKEDFYNHLTRRGIKFSSRKKKLTSANLFCDQDVPGRSELVPGEPG